MVYVTFTAQHTLAAAAAAGFSASSSLLSSEESSDDSSSDCIGNVSVGKALSNQSATHVLLGSGSSNLSSLGRLLVRVGRVGFLGRRFLSLGGLEVGFRSSDGDGCGSDDLVFLVRA